MKEVLDSILGLMAVGWRQLEPTSLRRGPWNEKKLVAEHQVFKGHRMGEVGAG